MLRVGADKYLGVMRFLQSEWHRHERDRNGWEIERQEMKGRIARLEGSTRKSDSSNKSLKKYINMLEKALKERDAQVKTLKAGLQPEPPVAEKPPSPRRELCI
jgi:striatin 1/3/4